jgi:hypothetical protein
VAWWLWALGGLVLLGIELLTPGGFFFLFFGLGAFATALLAALGVLEAAWAQWLAFTVGSVATVAVLRGRMRSRLDAGGPPVGGLVGEVGVLLVDLPPGDVGQMELRGTAWSARHAGGAILVRGARCRVVRVEGLMLWVAPEAAPGGTSS